ncbi:MAG: HAMP domain-containing histidine kinase [Streptococcaceae bacterium]|nr:HAMP domain-containing histidine kinase [Streptococcaceae bacterium]
MKGPSLTVKWAFASSLFIFVVFTIFAVITYKSSVNLIVRKERTIMERAVDDVSNRLITSDENLTTLTTISILQQVMPEEEELNESSLFHVSTFVSEISQPSLSIFVFNAEQEPIFSTRNRTIDLVYEGDQAANIVDVDGEMSFLMIREIVSEKTGKLIGYVQATYRLNDFYDIRERLLITLLILEFISLILSSILGYFLARYFLKPISTLRDTMLTIRNNPRSELQMKNFHTGDELEELSEIFNDMMGRIRTYSARQEQFVSDVSHELRTPVAIVEGHLSMLNRWGKKNPEVLDEGLEASLYEIQRMKSLIQEMLDLTRAGNIDPNLLKKPVDAMQVIEQVVNNFRLLQPNFTINLHVKAEIDKKVQIYRNHLEQVVIIILDNAIKYSTNNYVVDITVETNQEQFIFTIQDYGEGIKEEDLEQIFNRFYRVDKSRVRITGGNGLGLPIAKRLIEAYKGTVEVSSQLEKGTSFTVSLPFSQTTLTENEE